MTLSLTDPAEIDLARQLNERLGVELAAAVWPLVRDAALVCRCNGVDRHHTRGDRDFCIHRPGGPAARFTAAEQAATAGGDRG